MDIRVYGKFIMSGGKSRRPDTVRCASDWGKGELRGEEEGPSQGNRESFNVNSMKIFDSDTHRPDTVRCASD
jgi:hypothetical protein